MTLEDKERSFVEVILNRDKFEARPASAALQDERHQYFVLANLKELSSLDIRRIIAAAKRLAAVKPTSCAMKFPPGWWNCSRNRGGAMPSM